MIAATWFGRMRLAVRAAALTGPAGVRISSPTTAWELAGIFGEDLRLTLVEPQAGLSIRKLADPVGSAWNVEARGLDVGRLLDVRHDANPLLPYLDRVVYIANGHAYQGPVRSVITTERLSALFGVPIEVLTTRDGRLVVVGQPEAPHHHGHRHEHADHP